MPEKSDTLIDVKGNNRNDDFFEELRRRAENTLEHNSGADINAKDLQEAVHELQVHQIELGMQNEELVRTRDNLYEIKNKYQELFDYAPVGYFIIDTDSRVLEVNHAGVRLLGKPGIRGGSLVIFNDYLNQLFSSRRPQNFEVEVRADGSRAWVHWRSKPIKNKDGNTDCILGVGQDITEQKKARDIIKRDNKKLELLVEERTKQLLKAQKKIEESKRLTDLGRLAATVAHELRRPFASLKLSLYNIRKKRTNSKIDTHIDRCDEKIFEGEQIINNLLKSSSLHEPELQEIDLNKILSECLIEMQNHYVPRQIKEVVYNILQNSYEAFFPEEGAIRVNEFIAGETAGFSITDNDEGIPKEEMEKVTEPFYTTKHRGIGLGLTIAKEIVSGHGGSLDIESKKGVGTTVTVTLPKNKEK